MCMSLVVIIRLFLSLFCSLNVVIFGSTSTIAYIDTVYLVNAKILLQFYLDLYLNFKGVLSRSENVHVIWM